MTPQGYRARIYAVEWLANLWVKCGAPQAFAERMMRYCTECIESDFYAVERPVTDDPYILRAQAHFDALFAEPAERFPSGVSFA